MTRGLPAALAMTLLLPLAAAAQPAADAAPDLTAGQNSQGPMIVERIHNGFLAAPDFKITEVDHKTSGLAGGYAGVVFADSFFIGGGGYGTVTNTHGNSDLAYGGLIMQWFGGGSSEPFGYGAKMLIGGGVAESPGTVQVMSGGRLTTQSVRFRQDFVVFEPEVSALVRFSKHLRLTLGAGYRFTGAGWHDRNDFASGPGHIDVNGAVGSVGLQIGSGS